MTESIDAAARAALAHLAASLEDGSVFVTSLAMGEQAGSTTLELRYEPTASGGDGSPRSGELERIPELVGCPRCWQPAEPIPEDNGGGFYCEACDHCW